MRLTSLVLRGFKSFADKTVLEFDARPCVTAFIGPNGCGKSNVIDAFRWVLGETNPRDLRSPSLEEVIFTGTHTRKPLSLGEVAIVLDNSDQTLPLPYTEVEVKRRVFRSGESEFYINREPCRLKDIRELFMDTGLGGNGYSILTQGQVDAILAARPDERQKVFEEVVGVAKFRARRDEALRKLTTTRQNLNRLEDLLDHLTRELSIMEETHQKAELKRKFLTRVHSLELFVLDAERRSLMEKLRAIQVEIARLETAENISSDAPSFASNSSDLQRIRTEVRDARMAFESVQDRYQMIREKFSEIEKAAALAHQELRLLRGSSGGMVDADISSTEDWGELSLEETDQKIAEGENRVRELAADLRAEKTLHTERKKFLEEKENEAATLRTQADVPDMVRVPKLSDQFSASGDLKRILRGILHHTFDAYVVSDVAVLMEYIAMSQKEGRDGFSVIALSEFQNRNAADVPRAPRIPGVVGWLHEQVKHPEGATLLFSIVGPVLFVENLETAKQFHTGTQTFPHPIVTRDGIVFMSSGEVHVTAQDAQISEGEHSRKRREALLSEVHRLQSHLHAEEEGFARKEVERETIQKELEALKNRKWAAARRHFHALEAQAKKLSVDLQSLQDDLRSAEKEAGEKKAFYLQRTDALERAERNWMEKEREIRARQEAVTQSRISQAKWEAELESLTTRAIEQYHMTPEEWDKFKSPLSMSKEGAQRELGELRRQLQGLGDVGEGSDVLYQRLQDRHRFLEEGCQDIERTRKMLEEEIARLDLQAQSSFIEGIQKINEEFNRMFSVLFRGGEARLELKEEGIEILTKPPGRRWMPLTLLSGGERSLTAIALLFALFQLRPSPFSLLDEVDAALDEANVGRFVDLIKDFANSIQVLVVTHNRKTMEAAESLYGVTMEEAGVSKVVSLKLDAVPA